MSDGDPKRERMFVEIVVPNLRRRQAMVVKRVLSTKEEIADAISSSLFGIDSTPAVDAMLKLAGKKGWR